jgi:hypothetical protein
MQKKRKKALLDLPKGIQGFITLFEQESWTDEEFDYGFAFHFIIEFCEAFIVQKDAKEAIELLKRGRDIATEDAEASYSLESEKMFQKRYDEMWALVDKLKERIEGA